VAKIVCDQVHPPGQQKVVFFREIVAVNLGVAPGGNGCRMADRDQFLRVTAD